MSAADLFAYPGDPASAPAGFLANLHEDEVAIVLGFTQTVRFAAGELALRRGEQDRSLYVVAAGQFEILVPTPRGPRRVRLVRPGDLFGELAFFDNQPRSADVRALVESEVLVMSSNGFDRLRLARPQLALAVVLDLGRVLSLRFRDYNRRLAALNQH